jgi:uncharacterized protein YabN with tetrapyrrole methylase and pyrophosphatase domain
MPSKKSSVYVIGLGIPEFDSMTLAGVSALQASKSVYSAGPGLTRKGFLEAFCPDVRRIDFDQDAEDQDAEFRAKLEPLFIAASKMPVAFVTFAHPMYYDTACHWIMEGCKRKKIPCKIVSGVSSIDAVFSALRISLLNDAGVQAGDLSYFRRVPPDPGSYSLLFRAHVEPEGVRTLLKDCRKSYPASHRVAFVRCENDERFPEKIRWMTLKDCARRLPRLDAFTSVLIPPRGTKA